MLNGVDINYIVVILITGAVFLAALYHSVLYLHRKTLILAHYSGYLWFTFFYLLLRLFTPVSITATHPLFFLNPDESLLMAAAAMYVRFMGTALDIDKEKEKAFYNYNNRTKYIIVAYIFVEIILLHSTVSEIYGGLLSVAIRLYLFSLGLFYIFKVIVRRKIIYYNYLAVGAVCMILFGLAATLVKIFDPTHHSPLNALSFLLIGYFADVIFFSSAIGYKIKTDAMEKEKAQNMILEQNDFLRKIQIEKIETIYKTREDERIRIAKDLHDDIGASLSSIHLYTELAAKTFDTDPQKTKRILQEIESNSQKAMDEMGDIVWAIRPSADEDKNLSSRIKNYGAGLLAVKNINCNYNIEAALDKLLVNVETRKNILLIIKEAINNIAKYSCAANAAVNMITENTCIVLSVTDDGKGFDIENIIKGNGLTNMQNRTRYMEGTFNIISSSTAGTQVICTIPLTKFSE